MFDQYARAFNAMGPSVLNLLLQNPPTSTGTKDDPEGAGDLAMAILKLGKKDRDDSIGGGTEAGGDGNSINTGEDAKGKLPTTFPEWIDGLLHHDFKFCLAANLAADNREGVFKRMTFNMCHEESGKSDFEQVWNQFFQVGRVYSLLMLSRSVSVS